MHYTNPRMHAVIDNWPFGSMRTTATFTIETHPKRGQRGVRTTIDPKNGRQSKPKTLTFAKQARNVDGDDGKTYILEHTGTHLSVMQSNMQYQQEAIFGDDERFLDLVALFA